MKFVCNECGKPFQADDITIHYTTGAKGLEITAICQLSLDTYLDKITVETNRKDAKAQGMDMKRKW